MTRAARQQHRDLIRSRRKLMKQYAEAKQTHKPTDVIRLKLRDITTAAMRIETGEAA
jgi:hypothetical protein